uniref:Uncharacterized protein n=1 Tax=Arundo donax TaxID=35708 RepID=A0A0A9AUN5_ARUDO
MRDDVSFSGAYKKEVHSLQSLFHYALFASYVVIYFTSYQIQCLQSIIIIRYHQIYD